MGLIRYPVDNFLTEWNITAGFGFGAKTFYGYHEGVDINDNFGGDHDLGKQIFAIAKYTLDYYHFKSHIESGFGVHYVYKIEGKWGTRWVHCAHNMRDPEIQNKRLGNDGETISKVGETGRPRGLLFAHLHFAIFKVDPNTLPNGIDTIAETQQQLNDWWEDPIRFIEKWMDGNGVNPDPLQECLRQHGELVRELELIKKSLEGTKGEVTKQKVRAEGAESREAGLKIEVKELKKQLADKDEECQERLETLRAHIIRLEESLESANKAVRELTATVEEKVKKLDDEKKAHTKTKKKLAELEAGKIPSGFFARFIWLWR